MPNAAATHLSAALDKARAQHCAAYEAIGKAVSDLLNVHLDNAEVMVVFIEHEREVYALDEHNQFTVRTDLEDLATTDEAAAAARELLEELNLRLGLGLDNTRLYLPEGELDG